jgi:glutathione peroxidase
MLKLGVGFVFVLIIGGIAAAYAFGFIFNPSPAFASNEKSIYEFAMKDIDGKDIKLDQYKGKTVMIVNTASKCGLTPQYEALQAIYDKYKAQGFTVLGFPANNFLGQEPGTETEIKEFCTLKYKVTFPMFAKISVKGKDQNTFYSFLTSETSNPGYSGDISWNFEKFLISKDGKTLARFAPSVKPDSTEVIAAIEKALK